MADPTQDGSCKLVAEFFSIFAHPTRVQIFCALRDGARTVSELAEMAQVTIQNASQHLRVMRDKGAVASRKDGQKVYYEILDPRLIQACELIYTALVEALQRRAGMAASAPMGGH